MPIVQQRRGTAASLQFVTLAAGQIAYETDTGKVKVGDGTTVYSGLEYITDASNIADGSINTNHLADNAVDSNKILNSAVGTSKLAGDAVTGAKIADGSVNNSKLADSAVSMEKMQNSSVITGAIQNSAVTADKLATGSVTEVKIATGAVTVTKINDGSVVNQKIATNAVTADKIHGNTITEDKIAPGAITGVKIANGSVDTNELATNAVTENKIASGAVTSGKIADSSVQTAKIADDAITSAKIAQFAVDTTEIAAGAVETGKLDWDAVTTPKIADDAVTYVKMQDTTSGGCVLGRTGNYGVDAGGEIQEIALSDYARTYINQTSKAGVKSVLGFVEQAEINTAIANLVDSAPSTLDTLNELASALGDNQNFAATVATDIGTNASNIATNLANVNANTGNIAANAVNISTNTASVNTNASNIAINTANVGSNTGNIAANAVNISTNTTNVAAKMPLAGGQFTGEVTHQGEHVNGFLAVGARILDAATIASGNGDSSLLYDANTIAKVKEIEATRGKRVTGLTNVSNTPSTNQTNYASPYNNKHWQWTGSAWQQVNATSQTWIGQYKTVVVHDWGQTLSDNTGGETAFQRILLYEDGSGTNIAGLGISGLGISASNFNIGTKGAINVSFYAAGVLNERKTGTLTRHYVDQFFNGKLYTSGGSVSLPIISREGDSNTGLYYPDLDKVALVAGGVEFLRGATAGASTVVSSSHLIDTSNFIYANGYRAKNNGSKTATAYGKYNQGDTGMYFPADDEVGISAKDKDRVKFDEDRTTFYRESGKETIKAGTENAGYMIIDSSGGYLSLNHYSPDHLLLNYTSGGSGNVIINAPSTTVSAANPTNRKLYVHGTVESSAETHAQRYLVNGYGTATDPAFEIAHTVDGTGFYSPSSMVNGGNSAGYGFAISAAHNHVAEFGYKSHIGNGRPTIYNGGRAALLELNGNSRRGSLFGYNIYNTSSSMANEAIGGEFLCIAQGGTSSNSPKGFKTKLQSQSANGLRAVGGHFELSLESVTGSWGNAYGVHCELNIASSCTGSLTGSSAALYVSPVGKTSNATYPSTDGIDNVYAIFQDGNTDNNRFDGTSWFKNNVHIVDNSDLDISSGSGQIILPNGSATDPAICFGADTNTGIKRNTNGNMDFVTDATNRLSITTSGDIHTSSGGTVYLNNHVTIGNTLTVTNGMNVSELAQSGATTGQFLKWDGSAWVPATVSGGGGGATTVTGLSDTTITGTPSDNSLLRYDAANSKWENYNPDGFSTSGGGSAAINLADGNKIHQWTCASSGVQAVTLLNIPSTSGISCSFTLVIKYPGSGTTTAIVQWPSSFKWPGGVAPTLTNTGGKQDTFTFLSLDNGASWLAHVGGQNF